MPLELKDLPYSHDALESNGMSKETLEFHHDIHHKAYVDNGNKLLSGTEWENKSLEEIIKGNYDSSKVAQNGIFNNASQHWNHCQFWEMMGPNGKTIPSSLEKNIVEIMSLIQESELDIPNEILDKIESSIKKFFKIKNNIIYMLYPNRESYIAGTNASTQKLFLIKLAMCCTCRMYCKTF